MYQGHKNRAHWNVALHLYNNQSLYRVVCREVRYAGNFNEAARNILDHLAQSGITETSDGCRYSYTAIRAAIAGHEF